MPNINRLSGKVAKVPSANADPGRFEYIDLQNTEPDLGVPQRNNALLSANTSGTNRVWVNLSDDFEVDPTGNIIIKTIIAGTF